MDWLPGGRPVEGCKPISLHAVEAAAAPVPVGQGNVTHEVTDELLDALTEAYREAMENIRA